MRAVWRDLWDSTTGKTSADYINEYTKLRADLMSQMNTIDRNIQSLKNDISSIDSQDKNVAIPRAVDRRPFLQRQIKILENKRALLSQKIERLNYTIAEESVEGIDREMMKTNKGYVNRLSPFET